MSKILCYHSDMDGVGNKILALYFGLNFDYMLMVDYNFEETKQETINKILEFNEIFFTDFCPSKDYLLKLLDLNKKVWIYDHHLSSEFCKEIKHENLIVSHDKNRCGTKIFFEDYIKKEVENIDFIDNINVLNHFITLVDTYDCWRQDDKLWQEADSLNKLLYKMLLWDVDPQHQYDNFVDIILEKLDTLTEWKWTTKEMRLVQEARDREDRIYNESNKMLKKRIDEKDFKFGIFKAGANISVVCSRLLKEHEDLEYIICINTFKPEGCKISIRSKVFDCTQLNFADGHEQACGGALPSLEYVNDFWDAKIYTLGYKEKIV
jgi:oligoribonuclease NrnB/cAMP/cGMP phosphodiesterase (DHH superfamily)